MTGRGRAGRIILGVLLLLAWRIVPAHATSLTATGQWALQTPPGSGQLNGVATISSSNAWAVGFDNNGNALAERWDGSSWSIVPNQLPAHAASNGFNGVAAVTASDIWAVGDYFNTVTSTTQTLIEHWDGSAWSVVPSPNPAGFSTSQLNAVAAISSSDVWAVGSASSAFPVMAFQPLIEHWDGTSWTIVSSPNPSSSAISLTGVAAISSSDVWAAGDYFNPSAGARQTLVEHWNGAAWSIVPSPNQGTGDNFLYSVTAASSSNVWAVGSALNTTTNATQVLIERWNGSAWSIVPAPNQGTNNNQLSGVSAISASDVWAAGFYAIGTTHQTLTEHWNGTTWAIVPSPSTSTSERNQLNGVSAVAGSVFAVGQLTSSPLALMWPAQPTGQWTLPSVPGTGTLNGVAALSSTDVWAVGSDGSRQTLTEHWNGTAWSVVPSPNPDAFGGVLTGVAAVSSSDVWAVGYHGNFQTLIEHWNGSAWSIVSSPNQPGTTTDRLFGVAAIAANNVWAVGDFSTSAAQPLIEHWDGTQWSIVAPSSGSGGLRAISAISSSDIWAAGSDSSQKTVTFHWNGTSWSPVSSPNQGTSQNFLYGIAAVSSSDVWAVGSYVNLATGARQTLTEHWNGTAWSIVPSPSQGTNANELYAISAGSSTDVWAVGYYNNGSAFQTLTEHWNGIAWSILPSPNTAPTDSDLLNSVTTAGSWRFAVGQGPSAPLAEWWTIGPSVTIAGTGTNGSGKPYVIFNLKDPSGLTQVAGTKATNCTLAITQSNGSPFGPQDITPNGTVAGSYSFTSLYPTSGQVTATKIISTQSCVGSFNVSDPGFATTYFDPVITPISRDPGTPATQTVQVMQAEHWVTIANFTPGLSQVFIVVNGKTFLVKGLHDGEKRMVDIGSALASGTNTVRLVAIGRKGASALILFSS